MCPILAAFARVGIFGHSYLTFPIVGGWATFEKILTFRVADPPWVSRGRDFDFSMYLAGGRAFESGVKLRVPDPSSFSTGRRA